MRLFCAFAFTLIALQVQAWAQAPRGYVQPASYPPAYGPPGAYAGPMGMQPGMPMQGGPMMQPGPMMGPPPDAYGPPAGMGCPQPCGDVCPPPWCVSQWSVYGDFLYLRPRNAGVAYAVPFNGPLDTSPLAAPPVQTGQVGVVEMGYDTGFRAGVSRALSDCSAIAATYTHFETTDSSAISTDLFLIRSLVSHPSTWISNAESDFTQAAASQHIEFDLGDLDYRWTFANNARYSLTMLAGGRYMNLKQTFNSQFDFNVHETVDTNIRFEGGGLRIGLEGERRDSNMGFFVYGKGAASFVAGTSRASYAQVRSTEGLVVDTGIRQDAIITMLDLELGAGWMSPGERVRLSAGYMVSGWYNVLKTDDFIQAVRQNNFVNLGNTMTFDGLVARAEVRF